MSERLGLPASPACHIHSLGYLYISIGPCRAPGRCPPGFESPLLFGSSFSSSPRSLPRRGPSGPSRRLAGFRCDVRVMVLGCSCVCVGGSSGRWLWAAFNCCHPTPLPGMPAIPRWGDSIPIPIFWGCQWANSPPHTPCSVCRHLTAVTGTLGPVWDCTEVQEEGGRCPGPPWHLPARNPTQQPLGASSLPSSWGN